MALAFDDAVARAFADALHIASETLPAQGILRAGAVEHALEHFSGPYAELFTTACLTETDNRVRLARVLFDLSDQVRLAAIRAADERERQQRLGAWELREAEREERRRSDPASALAASLDAVFDGRPPDEPVVPPPLSAEYLPWVPRRTSAGALMSAGRTSADPDRLGVFVSEARAANAAMRAHLDELNTRWATFRATCAWARSTTVTVFRGFAELIDINRADADWIEQVAVAFSVAGGGLLSTPTLDLASSTNWTTSDQGLLRSLATLPTAEIATLLAASPRLEAQLRRMDPATVHTWWTGLAPTGEAQLSKRQEALIAVVPAIIGNLDGIPYGARARANSSVLTARMAALMREREALVGASSAEGVARREAVKAEWEALVDIEDSLDRPVGGDQRFLISLTNDVPPLAAVSIGDLDTATSVTYAVPGMGQTTTDISRWAKASQNVQSLLPPGSAVVAWVGYEMPPVPSIDDLDLSVLEVNDAVAGGAALASAVRGLVAVRGDTLPKPHAVGHSYGSTVIAASASRSDVAFGTVVTLGSAGLPDSVKSVGDLNVEAVYSGQARSKYPGETESGDEAAWVGRDLSRDHHVNPVDPDFGAEVFGVESGGDTGRVVTNHGALMSDDGALAGYLDKNSESLRNTARALSGRTDVITENKKLGPTEFQKTMDRMVSGAYTL
ncbi:MULTISPECIES: alpha/beta hydrolase [unclassified Rathayibacter]|uniref:alpha/beta hydrolase n=1 Tax=unclassified Rathayibacter TaxID=2609250 RepID=UPI00188A2849|nr:MULTISPECIES: alpha/beta hydrolase [unclassified Rathayibacter]MBF4461455.1 hypothetical protein [Rathayibacter sp. VKM Ac-2879]MBF4502866.1 hypothetical protein [Rathayibacter sp. VKM Ac-2878]